MNIGYEKMYRDTLKENAKLRQQVKIYKNIAMDYLGKTEWVQKDARPEEFGMSRIDVINRRLEKAEAERDALVAFSKELHCAVLSKNYPVCKALLDEKLPDISNKRDIEQQIKALESTLAENSRSIPFPYRCNTDVVYSDDIKCDIEQLRKELDNG